jgi:hypothetical protein
MKEVIVLTIISGLVFFTFLVIIILGFTKKNKKLKMTSLIVLFVFIVCAGWTGYKIVDKTYNKVAENLRPRNGEEIYESLFGESQTDCNKILNYQDQVIPKIDYAIWLHFETCPAELRRILSLHDFKSEIVSTRKWNTERPLANENWFNPESLGDSILVSVYSKDDYGNRQFIYSSLDSTKVFVKDILD